MRNLSPFILLALLGWSFSSCSSSDKKDNPADQPSNTFCTTDYESDENKYYDTELTIDGKELHLEAARNLMTDDNRAYNETFLILDTLYYEDTTVNRAMYLLLKYKNKDAFTYLPVLRVRKDWLRADLTTLMFEDRQYSESNSRDTMEFRLRSWMITDDQSQMDDLFSKPLFEAMKTWETQDVSNESEFRDYYHDVMKQVKQNYALYKRAQVYFPESFEKDYFIGKKMNPYTSMAKANTVFAADKTRKLMPLYDSLTDASPIHELIDADKNEQARHMRDSIMEETEKNR